MLKANESDRSEPDPSLGEPNQCCFLIFLLFKLHMFGQLHDVWRFCASALSRKVEGVTDTDGATNAEKREGDEKERYRQKTIER